MLNNALKIKFSLNQVLKTEDEHFPKSGKLELKLRSKMFYWKGTSCYVFSPNKITYPKITNLGLSYDTLGPKMELTNLGQ